LILPNASQHAAPQAVVFPPAEDSVTHLCEQCGAAPARSRFCSGKCRQSAYRKSSAHAAQLEKLRDARQRRREDHYTRANRARVLGSVRGYSGPTTPGVPRLGELKLSNYLAEGANV